MVEFHRITGWQMTLKVTESSTPSPHFCTVCLSHVGLSAVEGFLFPLSPTLPVFQIKHRFLWGLRSCPSSLVGWLLLVLVFTALRTSFCGVYAYLFV